MSEATFNSTQDYVASKELLSSVNVAIALKKPLLIKGEPGTGKTMLGQIRLAKSLLFGTLNRRLRRRTDCICMILYSVCMMGSSARRALMI